MLYAYIFMIRIYVDKEGKMITKTNKTVCYTCITKNYDKLIQHSYISKDWDYVCFTDDKKLIKKGKVGIWLIKPLVFNSLEDKRNSGWHKTHPHIQVIAAQNARLI